MNIFIMLWMQRIWKHAKRRDIYHKHASVGLCEHRLWWHTGRPLLGKDSTAGYFEGKLIAFVPRHTPVVTAGLLTLYPLLFNVQVRSPRHIEVNYPKSHSYKMPWTKSENVGDREGVICGDQNWDVKRVAVGVEKRTESSRCSGVSSAALGVLEMGHERQALAQVCAND